MKLSIISTQQPELWDHAVQEAGGDDVYFSSSYCQLCEMNGEGQGQLAVLTSSEGHVLAAYPFMLRSIPCDKKNRFDICTAYGYGGPLINAHSAAIQPDTEKAFSDLFMDYCRQNLIITGFTRFHPLLCNQDQFHSWEPQYVRRTVYMDLKTSSVWDSIGSKNRNMIRKAQRNGIEVMEDNSPDAYEHFMKLYYHTMDRNAATEFYYFPRSYFTSLSELLGEKSSLFLAQYEGKIIAGAIILHSGGLFHYHLAASLSEYLRLAPNNLVLYTATERAKMAGGSHFHLGGGYQGEDSLFSFKASFSSLTAEFYVSKSIFMDHDYRELCNVTNTTLENPYFPAYRGK